MWLQANVYRLGAERVQKQVGNAFRDLRGLAPYPSRRHGGQGNQIADYSTKFADCWIDRFQVAPGLGSCCRTGCAVRATFAQLQQELGGRHEKWVFLQDASQDHHRVGP
jgi:hypothetical protein